RNLKRDEISNWICRILIARTDRSQLHKSSPRSRPACTVKPRRTPPDPGSARCRQTKVWSLRMKSTQDTLSAQQFDTIFQSVCNGGVGGAGDERGTLNYITPESVRNAAALVRSGRTVSMAVPIN